VTGFANVKELVDAELDGKTSYRTWRKSPSQASSQGIWFDLSMSPGNPAPQYYAAAPGVAIALSRSNDGGLDHGNNVAPATKHLRRMTILTSTATALPMPAILCDYLMFYPFIDEGTTDAQPMTNIVTVPRYTTGEGVQIMAVSVAGRTGGQSFSVTYTNSSGVAGRTTELVIENSATANGNIVTSDRAVAAARGPFLPLQAGDTGVRSIESVTMAGPDVGLFTLVLVKPIAQLSLRGIDAPVEIDYLLDFGQAPVIKDDAYLNLIVCPSGTLAATALHGDLTVVWN
jgi:hypothetical protein